MVRCGGYDRTLFEIAKRQIHEIIGRIKNTEPFSRFGIEDSVKAAGDILSKDILDDFDRIRFGGKAKQLRFPRYLETDDTNGDVTEYSLSESYASECSSSAEDEYLKLRLSRVRRNSLPKKTSA